MFRRALPVVCLLALVLVTQSLAQREVIAAEVIAEVTADAAAVDRRAAQAARRAPRRGRC